VTCGVGLAARGEREKGKWAAAVLVGWKRRWAARGKERREEGRWAAHCCWAVGVAGLRARKERREREKKGRGLGSFLLSFFSNLFKLIFQTFEIELFFKLFLTFQTFKHFKASHQQTKTPCIQIMMHKHLLLLNY
jgi:hypothetical protein